MPDAPDTYGEAIRVARTGAGLTQAQLGAKIGMSGRSVQDWERGVRTPVAHLDALERALGKPPGWFHAQVNVLERLLWLESATEEAITIHRENAQTLKDILAVLRLMMGSGQSILTLAATAMTALVALASVYVAFGYYPHTLREISTPPGLVSDLVSGVVRNPG